MSWVEAIIVGPTEQALLPNGATLTRTPVAFGGTQRTIWFRTRGAPPAQRYLADIAAPPLLLSAMRLNRPLQFVEPLSTARLQGMEQAQELISRWYPDRLRRVHIGVMGSRWAGLRSRLARVGPGPSAGSRTVACFTGGVDSFYTLTRARRVDAILFAGGLDIPLSADRFLRRVTRINRRIAHRRQVDFVSVRTNVRRFLNATGVDWGAEGHGAALASLAQVLSPVYGRFLIPSTHATDADIRWGSHHQLDPLWSTETTTVVHHGGTASRAEKTAWLADRRLPQRHLRVCYRQFQVENCGECAKCLRTMATLAVLGRLDRFRTFPADLDLDRLRAATLATPNERLQIQGILDLAQRVGGPEAVRGALESLVEAYDKQPVGGHNPRTDRTVIAAGS